MLSKTSKGLTTTMTTTLNKVENVGIDELKRGLADG